MSLYIFCCPGPYIPGEAGGAWSEDEISIVREKVQEMLNPDNYKGYHFFNQRCISGTTGLFVCDGSVYDMVPFVPEKEIQDNVVNCNIRCPKTSRVIQLAFHDCIKYTDGAADDAIDGCDGCLNFGGVGFEFKETWFVGNEDRPPLVNHFTKSYPIQHKTTNNGLEGSVRALEMIYTDPSWPSSARSLNVSLKESGKSRADLWAFAGKHHHTRIIFIITTILIFITKSYVYQQSHHSRSVIIHHYRRPHRCLQASWHLRWR